MKYKKTKHKGFTNQNKEDILSLFYRTELREDEKIVDNSDVTIAKELGHNKMKVCQFLSNHLNIKRDLLNKRVNL